MKFAVVFLVLILCAACGPKAGQSGTSVEDSAANRRAAAEHYLTVSPVKELMASATSEIMQSLPDKQRVQFKESFNSQIRYDLLEQAMVDLLVRHFTVAELKALAEFYGSPAGRSASQKFSAYTAELMPHIQREITRCAKAAMEQMASGQQQS